MKMPRMLPAEAHLKLIRAASTENTAKDPMAKQKAIEEATTWVRNNYPTYFKEEPEC